MLDSLGSTVQPSTSYSPNWTTSKLIHLEHDWLKATFGAPLTMLVEHFTPSPLRVNPPLPSDVSSDPQNDSRLPLLKYILGYLRSLGNRVLSASYAGTLVRFHLAHNGHTLRLRGMLPRHPIRDELLTIDNQSLSLTVALKYTRDVSVHRHAISARCQSTDAGLSLLGAVQLLLLVLSLLAPLHLPNGTAVHTSSTSTAFHHLGTLDWIVSETDCTRVPTLGWFYVNGSEMNNSSVVTQPPPIILSVLELLNNISSSETKSTGCWFTVVDRWIEYFTCELVRLLVWTESGEPAGLKINLHLARLLCRFFLYHILAWRIYSSFLIHLAAWTIGLLQQLTSVDTLNTLFYANLHTSTCLLLSTVYLVSSKSFLVGDAMTSMFCTTSVLLTYVSSVLRLTFALFGCLLLDLINLTTIHLTTFYIYTVRLLVLQTRVIGAAWRLCRNASKWNPLRDRVDTVPDMYNSVGPKLVTSDKQSASCMTTGVPSGSKRMVDNPDDTHLDRLFVATLLGLAVGLCLLPTTIAFYLTFALIRLLIVVVQQLLKRVIVFVMDVPVSSLLAWLFHTQRSRTELIMTAPNRLVSPFPMLKLKLVRPSFRDAYRLNRFLHNCDTLGPNVPVPVLLRRLLTAMEI
ncbi:Phosphatidylinositol N-acetylglucosaminyltransferase subunit Q [Clonorchis sinensis]|uniref:Phosphatidylinositol N-acetylglucosaminyltransferase subunit Q n=1 Tax=Clonorchis sinensis TaxID=79923 RepID=A0A8T1N0H9_CLOSI|nr:Phosphatidylinositol N-acetylglucosaminyltransferase subunit Q [Clonorchis sinensis]